MSKFVLRATAAVACATALSGCSLIGLLNMLSDAGAQRVRAGVRFAGAEAPARLALDVYAPRPAPYRREKPRALVVFFYGGFWESGARRDYGFVGEALAERGLVAVVPDYRVYPEARFPLFLQDAAAAASWARAHAAELGADPRRLFLMGHSAGAHIAAMLTLDERWLKAPPAGMIGLAGLYDFEPSDLPFPLIKTRDLFGPPRDWPRTQPIGHVDGREAPMLLLHGEPDALVGVANTRRLAERVRRAGGRVEAREYPGVGHEAIVAALGRPTRFAAPVLDDVVAWIDHISAD